ncbi:carbohydrate kinase [Diaphorobacter sp. HDW4A]|uniref:FGGY family carbohydrate kinase n=1 Tax=Diaphorobacter sp. HDW4A TaxID=2714924 RepID=UPI00140DC665|nr:FGGY family carbohydrate kinase [Diaphorobacter sp. HDW4A]QIL83493.1 carbohydrate kinase [Diaphorobacter sp. HDW4A]
MKTNIFIGIDMGSTGLKAVAFDAGSGASLAVAGDALTHRRSSGGGCELTAQCIHDALMQALASIAQQLGEQRVRQIGAIACTGHGAGLYALDAHGALLRGLAVASTDQRASHRAAQLAQQQGAALYEAVGCQPWSGQPTQVLAELVARGDIDLPQIAHLVCAKDYLTWLLTGVLVTDASDVSTAGLLSLTTGRPSELAFEVVGLPGLQSALPPLVDSGTQIGRLTPDAAAQCGLPAGIPVAAGAIDLLASLHAVGAAAVGQAVAVLGTWCVNAVIAPVREPKPQVGAIVRFGPPDQRLYLENSPSSMANVAWLARTLQFESAAAVVECAMSVPLGADGLRFAPFINGGGSPAHAKAGFIGLSSHHERTHMARAVVDAVLSQHSVHLQHLAACGLGSPARVAALGGGARDARMVQLLASLLGHPVQRCGDDETGARGAALYAAQSQGAPTAPLLARCSTITPDPLQATAHARFLADYAELMHSLTPAFAHLYRAHQ